VEKIAQGAGYKSGHSYGIQVAAQTRESVNRIFPKNCAAVLFGALAG